MTHRLTLREILKRNKCVSTIVILFIIPKHLKEFKCPSAVKWINQVGYIHKMKHYREISKRNELLQTATIWDASYRHYVTQKKSGTKKNTLLFHFYCIQAQAKLTNDNWNQKVIGEEWIVGIDWKGAWGRLLGAGKFLNLDLHGGLMGVHSCTNSLSFKLLQFITHRLCLYRKVKIVKIKINNKHEFWRVTKYMKLLVKVL